MLFSEMRGFFLAERDLGLVFGLLGVDGIITELGLVDPNPDIVLFTTLVLLLVKMSLVVSDDFVFVLL